MNRRHGDTVIPVLAITYWALICIFVCGAGLFYVYCTNQLQVSGTQLKALEIELADLKSKDEAVRARIAILSSPNALHKRRESDKTLLANYVEITRDHLQVMNEPTAGTDLLPVSNDQR